MAPKAKVSLSLLDLPAETRNEIYDYAIDWPDFGSVFERIQLENCATLVGLPQKDFPLCTIAAPECTSMHTPGLLLVNRQITSEVLPVLYKKPWVLSSPPPYIPQLAKPMEITEFISEVMLQRIRRVILQVDGLSDRPMMMSGRARCWMKTIESLQDIWSVKQCLEKVDVSIEYVEPDRGRGWTFNDDWHHRNVVRLLSRVSFE